MRTKKRFSKSVATWVAVSSLCISIPSCIDELYNLQNGISMDMQLGGDSLAIPIGSIDTIRLGDVLGDIDLDMLKQMEEGGYALTISDSMQVEVPKIDKSKLSISEKSFETYQGVDFGSLDLSKFEIPGFSMPAPSEMAVDLSTVKLGGLTLPSISQKQDISIPLTDFSLSGLSIDPLDKTADQSNLFGTVTETPPAGDPVLIPIADVQSSSITASKTFDYNVNVPDGINNISNVMLSDAPKAVFEIYIGLSGETSILQSGHVTPNVNITPPSLFIFEDALPGGVISFGSADQLNEGNGWKVKKTYFIDKLNLTGSPNNGVLNMSSSFNASGNLSTSGIQVFSNDIQKLKDMGLDVRILVTNVKLQSMEFDIPTVRQSITPITINFDITKDLPSVIDTVRKVYFENPARVSIDLQASNLPGMIDRTIKIESLVLKFPDQFIFKPKAGLSGSTYTITNEVFNANTGKTIDLELQELDLASKLLYPSKGNLSLNAEVQCSGTFSIDGRINTDSIKSPKFKVDIGSALTFKSADVVTADYKLSLPSINIPLTFSTKITDLVKHLGVIHMKEGTTLRLDITKPQIPFTLWADNILLEFPSFLKFKEDVPMNVYRIDGVMPDSVVLHLDAIAINDELKNGILEISDTMSVTGGVQLKAATVNSSEIEGLTGKVTINAQTSTLRVDSASVILNTLTQSIADTLDLIIPDIAIPSDIVSLDSILLDDNAQIELNVSISNMPTLSSDLMADVKISFPDMFMFSPGSTQDGNAIVINQAFNSEGKLSKTIGLRGMKFDGKPLNGVLKLNSSIAYTAGVSVFEPTVNSTDLAGKKIGVTVIAKLSNIGFSKVYGILSPNIPAIDQSFEIPGIPDFLKDDDVVLDISRPVVSLVTTSNLGIPVDAEVKLTPTVNGTALNASEQRFTLNIPKAVKPENAITTGFWISPDSAGKPAEYNFLETSLQELFKRIPDLVNFNIQAKTNQNEQHYYDLNADYNLNVGYDITIPFAFGKEFNIVIDTILAIDNPQIGEISSAVGGIEVLGNVLNSIPLELEMKLLPLNANMDSLGIGSVSQLIQAGAANGTATSSPLTLKIKDPQGKLKDLRGFKVSFRASSNETVAGTPIRAENFVKADLKVRVDGGINVGTLLKPKDNN